ncbi:hypothetical protein [Brevundimonas sp.]|uniref:hypothetical protein n=1 Tax=Brevundimonas sp. TaxID=1871086 RepID=UPI002899B8CF|nr:hypothetical protein [Brevundimonas sp.]
MSLQCFDKRGIPIERGDIVKVFHFIGARGKRHYMYKQCLGSQLLHPSNTAERMIFSHLDLDEGGGTYSEALGQRLDGYEIIQSCRCDHEHRPRADAMMEARK